MTRKEWELKVDKYLQVKMIRAKLAKINSGRRMAGKSHLTELLPELPEKPVKYILTDKEGNYLGTEVDFDFASEYAKENEAVLKRVDFNIK
jgi:hypothetical protein